MTEPELSEIESTTAWHPMLVALLEFYLPAGWQLLPEFLLTRLPQRVDIVVVRRVQETAGKPRKIHSILDHLHLHTLIEHKGPTDDLEPGDALTLLGYAAQYMRMVKVSDPAERWAPSPRKTGSSSRKSSATDSPGPSLRQPGPRAPRLGDDAVLVPLLKRLRRMAGGELPHEERVNRIAEQALEPRRHLPRDLHRDSEREVLLLPGPGLAILG
jgi:hypothetical protein